MASSLKAETAEKSKIWTFLGYQGEKPRTPSYTIKPKKHQAVHIKPIASGSSESGHSGTGELTMDSTDFLGPSVRNLPRQTRPEKQVRSFAEPRVTSSSWRSALASDGSSTGHNAPGRTYGVMTVSSRGWYLHPSQDALERRMSSLYPGYKFVLSGEERLGDKARVSHVREVWRLVTAVDEELTGKMAASPRANIDLGRHTSFGVQINYLIKLLGTAQKPTRSRQTGRAGSTENLESLPSHEEMMAYKILNKHNAFPRWMTDILRGTANEYLLYPLAPAGPVMKAVLQGPGPSSSSMERIAQLEAKLSIAKKELTKYRAEVEAGKKQADAEAKQRRAELLRGAERQVKVNKARRKDIKDMIAVVEQSVYEAEEVHVHRMYVSKKFMDQVDRWRAEGKFNDDDSLSDN